MLKGLESLIVCLATVPLSCILIAHNSYFTFYYPHDFPMELLMLDFLCGILFPLVSIQGVFSDEAFLKHEVIG